MHRNVLLITALLLIGVGASSRPLSPAEPLQVWPTLYVDSDRPPGSPLDETIYVESWEDGAFGWFLDDQLHDPHFGPDDWEPFDGTGSWRCFDADIGGDTSGGYANNWTDLLVTPPLDLQGSTTALSDFQFRLNCEANWDGASVWVLYGPDEDNLTFEQLTPASTPYNDPSVWAFQLLFNEETPGWSGENEPFSDSYQLVTVNLSPYVNQPVVKLALMFASDTAYSSVEDPGMFGFQVDNWRVYADDNLVWANNLDDEQIGGLPVASAGLPGDIELPDDLFHVFADNDAPAGDLVAGITEDLQGYTAYWVGPTIDLPILNPGENLYLDFSFATQWEDNAGWPMQERYFWRFEAYNPVEDEWGWNAGIDPPGYLVGNTGGTWLRSSDVLPLDEWDITNLSGMDDVQLRLAFSSPVPDRAFSFLKVDSLTIIHDTGVLDLSTKLHVYYPTTVGVPAGGRVVFTNEGAAPATDWLGVWSLDGAIYSLFPEGPFDLNMEASQICWLNLPDDDYDRAWIPEGVAEAVQIDAFHTFADDVPQNNNFPVMVDILPPDQFEVGMDSRSFQGSLTVPDLDEGPVVHIDPNAANHLQFPPNWTYQVDVIRFSGFFWNGDGSTGGAAPLAHMAFRIFEGGNTPGALITQVPYIFEVNPGYAGPVDVSAVVNHIPGLDNLSGDIWVQAVIDDYDANGVYPQPLPYRTGANPFQDYQFMSLANAFDGAALTDFGHHLTVVLREDDGPTTQFVLTPTNNIIPPQGGTVTYNLYFQTMFPYPINDLLYWTTVLTPAGDEVTINTYPFDSTPGMEVNLTGLQVTVPGFVPSGNYLFTGHVGFPPPSPLVRTSAFVVHKQAPGSAPPSHGSEYSDWAHGPINFPTVSGDLDRTGSSTALSEYRLSSPYPNPFNAEVSVTVELPETADLTVTVYNLAGQQVADLAGGSFEPGLHEFSLNGSQLASGLYFVHATVPGQLDQLRKVTLLK